jgi:hypothetical protein
MTPSSVDLIPYVSHINTISPPKIVTQLPKPNKDLSTAELGTGPTAELGTVP